MISPITPLTKRLLAIALVLAGALLMVSGDDVLLIIGIFPFFGALGYLSTEKHYLNVGRE